MTRIYTDLAVEVGLEGAILLNTFFMDAMASDDGEFSEPIKGLLEEYPYLSYRKVHRGIQNIIKNGYVGLVRRNHDGKFIYKLTDKGYAFFFNVVVPSMKH